MALDISSLDFQQARIKQVLFKSRLRSVLYGVREADAALLSRQDTPLGQWLDAVVLPKYGDQPEVRQIETLLQRMLTAGRELVARYQRGQIEEARADMERVTGYADQIDELLLTLASRAA